MKICRWRAKKDTGLVKGARLLTVVQRSWHRNPGGFLFYAAAI
jgi:hypothetical protein